MFKRIKIFFQDVRINLSFKGYESSCRIEHESQAEKQFSTKNLQDGIRSINIKIDEEADSIFINDIGVLVSKISKINSGLNTVKTMLSYFVRNYKDELNKVFEQKTKLFTKKDELFTKKTSLKVELSKSFEGKNNAYETLNEYKGEVNAWYSKSERTPWLFGTGGKKIPNHSFFRQSHGDLEYYKDKRDEAYAEAQEWNSEIDDLKHKIRLLDGEIVSVNKKIEGQKISIIKIKDDRTYMYKLKDEGHREWKLKHQLKELESTLRQEQHKLNEQETLQKEFVNSKKNQYGIITLEKKILSILEKKDEYIKSFNLPINHEKRIVDHRAAWLKKRNLA